MPVQFKRGGYPVFQLTLNQAVVAYQPVQINSGILAIPLVSAPANTEFAAHIPGGEAVYEFEAMGNITRALGLGRKLYSVNTNPDRVQTASGGGTFVGYGLNTADVSGGGKIDVLVMGPGS